MTETSRPGDAGRLDDPSPEPPHGGHRTEPLTGARAGDDGAPPPRRRAAGPAIALAVAVAVIVALVAMLVWQRDDADDADDVDMATTTTEEPATTTEPATTHDTGPPTTAPPATTAPVDASTAVFPDAASGTRFTDPVGAARAFAVDFVGFTDPLVGEFMQGDARSGEVEVRPTRDGPATTVFVRQLGTDGSWWVLGSATANISTDSPGPGDAIASPVAVAGSALAFEGTVAVEVRQDGSPMPLGAGVVTGGGDVARPFSGEVTFSSPGAEFGALVFLTPSADDGRVWEAAVIRIRFA